MPDDANLPAGALPTPAAATPPQQQIQIPIDLSKLETVYTNFFRLSLSSSTEEVLMDIGVHSGIMTQPGMVEPIHLTHRMVMNPYVAKRVMESLRQIVARYEQMFGVLDVDPQRRLRGGPR
ncbi:MAG TPA: DUF3467 domain-containing protein [Fimbriiglobus sp.]